MACGRLWMARALEVALKEALLLALGRLQQLHRRHRRLHRQHLALLRRHQHRLTPPRLLQ